MIELERLRELSPAYAAQQEFVRNFRAAIAAGNPPDRLRRDAPTWSERFDAQVLEGLDGCLIWDGPMRQRSTGRIPVLRGPRGRERNARVYALERAGISVPSHRRVIPTCNSARCVAVEHLMVESHHWTRRVTREQMVGRLQVIALRLGVTPTTSEWAREGGQPSSSRYQQEFGSWEAALKAAGLERRWTVRKHLANGPGECRAGIRALARRLNRPPTSGDVKREAAWLQESGHPSSAKAYYRHLGGEAGARSWAVVLERAGLR